MIAPRLLRHEDGVVFEDLAPFYVVVLMEVPELLAPDAPDEVKRRLYPMPSDDADAQEEWRRLVHPELFALIASARDIMRRDLSALEQRREPGAMPAWRVEIPAAHVEAWISGPGSARNCPVSSRVWSGLSARSWLTTTTPSFVTPQSSSSVVTPISSAWAKPASVFSGRSARAPR
jgi:hypothetical protein